MELADILDLVFFGGFLFFGLWELVRPARRSAGSLGWKVRGAVAFALYLGVAIHAPFLWEERVAAHRVVDLSGQAWWVQGILAFLSAELVMYAWHRALHQVPALWRIHQTHHSAEEVDLWGAFYFHPLGMLAWTFTGSLALVWVVGVDAEVALVVGTLVGVLGFFQHANVRTPRWLGWLTARPEMHAAHHERGRHTDNFCDLPLIDWLFGTYRNPVRWDGEAGFYEGSSERVVAMLLLQDIEEPPETPTRSSLNPA